MRHIRDHYHDVTDEFTTPGGYWASLGVKVAHMARPDGDTSADYLVLTDEGVYHAWGTGPVNIRGQTFTPLGDRQIQQAASAACLFDKFGVWY